MRMRNILLASSAAFVFVSAQANDQAAKVVFGTDPGAAHPKYVDEALQTGTNVVDKAPAPVEFKGADSEQDLSVAEMMSSTPHPEQPAVAMAKREEAEAKIVQVSQSVPAKVQEQKAEITRTVATQDTGSLDYGYETNEMDLRGTRTANGAPTVLVSADQTAPKVVAEKTSNEPQMVRASASVTVAEKPAIVEASMSAPAQTSEMKTIRVQQGETVYGLARTHGVTAGQIIEANALQAPFGLSLGQTLMIPSMEASQAEVKTAAYKPAVMQSAAVIKQIQTSAPVQLQAQAPARQTYVVQPGNTMYSISRAYGIDVNTLAKMNNIPAPYTLSIGQELIVPGAASRAIAEAETVTPKPAINQGGFQREAAAEIAEAPMPVSYSKGDVLGKSRFDWPLQGKIVMGYGLGPDGRRNDGVNIAAPVGSPVRAVEDGEVVYRGSELEGYGNLLLIRHTNGWVSAYAHTDAMLVRKGERVKKGQVVAKVGTTWTVGQPQLHFELRHDLKPTDPIAALEGRDPEAIQ